VPTFTIHQAKTNLSELIRRAEAGEEIIIARGDKPVAVLRDYNCEYMARRRKSAFGSEVGKYPTVPDEVMFGPISDEEFLEMFGQDLFDLHRGQA